MRTITKILTAGFLSVSLLFDTIFSALPASAAEETYTVKDLFSSQVPSNSTIIISNRDDLVLLDRYVEDGMSGYGNVYTFRLENDIALSDYTFERLDDPAVISIYQNEKLAAVYNEENEKFYTDTTLQTVCDFSFEGEGWNPIGNTDSPFYGTFDGNGHHITGLWNVADTASDQTDLGLFAQINNAVVSNLTIDGAFLSIRYTGEYDPYASVHSTGILSSEIFGSSIKNCSIQNAFLSVNALFQKNLAVGGLCGDTMDDYFQEITVDASVRLHSGTSAQSVSDRSPASATDSNASSDSDKNTNAFVPFGTCGLIAGTYVGDVFPAFINCKVSGRISDEDTGFCIGGLCGRAERSFSAISCANNASLSSACIAGGLTGCAGVYPETSLPIFINDCQNTASISGIYAGGLIGISNDQEYFNRQENNRLTYNTPLTVIVYSENTGTIQASSRGGGIAAQCAAPYLKDCSNHGIVENILPAPQTASRTFLYFDSYPYLISNKKLLTADLQNIQETMACIGGLVGQSYCKSHIYNSYNDSSMITRFAICGGLIGRTTEEYSTGVVTVENCFFSGQISKTPDSFSPVIRQNSGNTDPANNTTASAVRSPSPSDDQLSRPVLTAGLIGYCYDKDYTRIVGYCYTTQADLPFCGYWERSIIDGTPLSASQTKPANCALISLEQLTGTESLEHIGTSDYNSYPDLLSCLNAWVQRQPYSKTLYALSGYDYLEEAPASWTAGNNHPVLTEQTIIDPRITPAPQCSFPVAPAATPSPIETPVPAVSPTTTPDQAASTTEIPDPAVSPATTPDQAASTTEIPDPAVSPATTPDQAGSTTEIPGPAVSPTKIPLPATRRPETPVPAVSPTTTPDQAASSTEIPSGKSSVSQALPEATGQNTTSSPKPLKLTLRKTVADKSGGIRIVWNCNKRCDGYQIYRASGQKKSFRLITTLNMTKRNKYFSQAKKAKTICSTYIDTTVKPNRSYYYKIVPCTLQGSSRTSGNSSNTRKAVSRLMAPVLTVQRRKNSAGQRYLHIKLRRYQGRYADIYIRKNHKKYTLLQLRNDNIRQQKAAFDLHYTFRKATIAVKLQTFQTKKRVNGSFYSKEVVLQIRE